MRWGGCALTVALGAAASLLCGSEATAHPSLLFSASEEPALRQQVQTGVRGVAYAGMTSGCDYYVGYGWWPWGPCLEEYAFLYRMEGDEIGHLDEARATLLFATSYEPTIVCSAVDHDCLGAYAVAAALAYDLLYDGLSAAERQAVVTWLEQYGELLYEAVDGGGVEALTSGPISAYAGLGFLTLAILHDASHPDLATWLDTAAYQLATVAFADAWNPGGAYDEGYGRSRYGTPLALRFAEAYRRETGIDLLDGANIAQAPDWYVRSWLPHGAFPRFGEEIGSPAAYGGELLLLVSRAQSELGKWGWHQLHGSTGVEALSRGLPISDRLAIALWYPDEVVDIGSPALFGAELDQWFSDTHNPAGGHVGADPGQGGVGVFRNGWQSDSVVVACKVSDEWQEHSHNDASSFVLSAYGKSVVMDPGPGTMSSQRNDHSVVTVASHNDGAERRTRYRGELLSRFSCSFGAHLRADARFPSGEHEPGELDEPTDDTWTPVERAERSLTFVRGPRPYLIVVDDLSADGTTAESYTWRLQLSNEWMPLSGTGPPWDPMRLENTYGGQQLVVSFVEPEVSYFAAVEMHPDTWGHYQLYAQTDPTVDARFVTLVQPLRSGAEEVPVVTRLNAAGGVGAQLGWSDGVDLVLTAFGGARAIYGTSSSDAQLLLVRYDSGGLPLAWLAAEGSDVVAQGLGLLDSQGLTLSASFHAGELEVQSVEPPSPRQIAAYAPGAVTAELNGQPVPFARAGSYVVLPIECADQERCNGVDDDCDGLVDESDAVDATTWYLDADGDGWGVAQDELPACQQPAGYAPNAADCDDTDDESYPGAAEDCEDGEDNDCDGRIDREDPACATEPMVMGTSGGCSCRLARPTPTSCRGFGAVALGGLLWLRRRRRLTRR